MYVFIRRRHFNLESRLGTNRIGIKTRFTFINAFTGMPVGVFSTRSTAGAKR